MAVGDSEEVKEFKTSLESQPEKMLAFLRDFINYCSVDLKQVVCVDALVRVRVLVCFRVLISVRVSVDVCI